MFDTMNFLYLKYLLKNEDVGFFNRDNVWVMVANEKNRMNSNDKKSNGINGNAKRGECRYFRNGKCNNGDNCWFRHSEKDNPKHAERDECRYYRNGQGNKGNSFRFEHSEKDESKNEEEGMRQELHSLVKETKLMMENMGKLNKQIQQIQKRIK